jgi:adenylylsulfate kinase
MTCLAADPYRSALLRSERTPDVILPRLRAARGGQDDDRRTRSRRTRPRGREFRTLHSDGFSRNTYERTYRRVLGTDDDWTVDGTFYRREWRERFYDLGGVRIVCVTASLETCLRRSRERADPIDEDGVHVVHREFDRPRADLTVDTDETSLYAAAERVADAVER